MKNLVTFFSENEAGLRLVGVGLTDEIIEHLKTFGGILQEAERTGQGVDLVVMYAPDLNGLVKKINSVTGSIKNREIKIL